MKLFLSFVVLVSAVWGLSSLLFASAFSISFRDTILLSDSVNWFAGVLFGAAVLELWHLWWKS